MADDRSVTHATYTLERAYAASPDRVFGAWANPVAKAAWFSGPDGEHQLDFQVGGREVNHGGQGGGKPLTFTSVCHDNVPDRRLVCASALYDGETLATVSLTTVEFTPADDGTRLLLTGQGAFLDGHEDPAWREQDTGGWLAALGTIARDLRLAGPVVQWAVTAYALAFSGPLLWCGRAADPLGRRRMFLAGRVPRVLASSLCGFAPSGEVLVAARAPGVAVVTSLDAEGMPRGATCSSLTDVTTRRVRQPDLRTAHLAPLPAYRSTDPLPKETDGVLNLSNNELTLPPLPAVAETPRQR